MFRRGALFVLILIGLTGARFAFAVDQSSTNYQNIGPTFAPTVKDISSASYLMTASFDAIVGLSISPSYSLRNGVPINDTNPVVPPVCGNGVAEAGEACDNGGSNGVCPQICSSSCTTNSCSVTGGGGGVGGAFYAPLPPTGGEFSGYAFSSSRVVLLKDGQIAAISIAEPDGKFKITLTGVQAGSYTFGLYAENGESIRSSIYAIPIFVTSGSVATVSGIFIAPTIGVDKDVVKRGEDISIFGQMVPAAIVTIQVNSDPVFVKVDADTQGAYLYAFNTGLIENGSHIAKSTAALGGTVSGFSKAVAFEVNDTGIGKQKSACAKADLNCDGKVSIADFSIAAFWYKHPLSPSFLQIELERLNGDGKLDFIDFSFMAYYWSG